MSQWYDSCCSLVISFFVCMDVILSSAFTVGIIFQFYALTVCSYWKVEMSISVVNNAAISQLL